MGSLFYAGVSGFSGFSPSGVSGSSGDVIPKISGHRLSLSTSAIPNSNLTGQTTLYLVQYASQQISLYYDSRWQTFVTAQESISLSGKTANKNHDVFAYYSGSAVTLELVEWTNDTTRATSLATQNGVYVKNTDSSRKYLGTIRTTGVTGESEDSYSSRYVWNLYNKVKRWGFAYNTNTSWTYSSAAWREFNNGSGEGRFKCVFGMPQTLPVKLCSDTAGTCYIGAAIDTTTNPSVYIYMAGSYVQQSASITGNNYDLLSAGYHYMTGIEYCISGTLTNYGYGSATNPAYSPHALFEG